MTTAKEKMLSGGSLRKRKDIKLSYDSEEVNKEMYVQEGNKKKGYILGAKLRI